MVPAFAEEPYEAMGELCRRPLVYRVVVLSLQGVYQEELKVVGAVKKRFPHIEVYLAHTDGRQAAVAEGMRQGADGLVSEEGMHRTSPGGPVSPTPAQTPAPTVVPPNPPAASVGPVRAKAPPVQSVVAAAPVADEAGMKVELLPTEPLLTPEELRALLDDEPSAIGGG
jgi:hypothetical protein